MPKQVYAESQSVVSKKKSRIRNVGDWCLLCLGFPLAYLILPISCCVRNPAAKVMSDDDDNSISQNKVGENIAVGCGGAIAFITCGCCCCGNFGKYGPRDI